MNPKQFLQIGGVVLLLVGILGFIGVIGPTPDQSPFGEAWYFDTGENWAHTILGIVALIAAFSLPEASQKMLTMLVGLIALFFGVYNIFSTNFLGTALQSPADMILHFAVGIWALYAAMAKPAPATPTTT